MSTASTASASTLRIHTSSVSAAAIKAVGEVLISAKWKETANQSSKERAVLIPMECVKAPEVPESFRALVESVLLNSAVSTLKSFVNSHGDSAHEMDLVTYSRPELVNYFLDSSDSWMSKQELELSFTSSATWKKIVNNPLFVQNKTYQNAANHFKDCILKLSGKAVQIPAEKCDLLLSKISDEDLNSPFGEFVSKRLVNLKEKNVESFDLSAL